MGDKSVVCMAYGIHGNMPCWSDCFLDFQQNLDCDKTGREEVPKEYENVEDKEDA